MVVKEANPWTVMCSYNRLNGHHASQNRYLLTEILRDEWGYDGFVVSDWGANHTTIESLAAGQDLEMPGPAKYYGKLLQDAIRFWQVEPELLNEAVRRILRIIFRSGRMDDGRKPGSVNTPEHQVLAQEVAEEAITLLKNEGELLPVKGSIRKLAIIGPAADGMVANSGGSSHVKPPFTITPLQALKERLAGQIQIGYEPGCSNAVDAGPDEAGIQRAVELAQQADMALVFVGLPEYFETEGIDRDHMRLTGDQDRLVKAVLAANPKTAVILNCGAPVEMPWADDVPAILHAYYPGMMGGAAVARILLGEVNPSGKMPVTYPRRLEDTPAYINYPGGRKVVYGERLYVGYRYYQTKKIQQLFPFGHGLSYTRFEYADLEAPAARKIGEPVEVQLTVTNTGSREGKETVQLYISDLEHSLDRPLSELKGFTKVSLRPGESTRANFTLDRRAFAFYDDHKKDWVVEPGEFELWVGSSSEDIRLKTRIRLD